MSNTRPAPEQTDPPAKRICLDDEESRPLTIDDIECNTPGARHSGTVFLSPASLHGDSDTQETPAITHRVESSWGEVRTFDAHQQNSVVSHPPAPQAYNNSHPQSTRESTAPALKNNSGSAGQQSQPCDPRVPQSPRHSSTPVTQFSLTVSQPMFSQPPNLSPFHKTHQTPTLHQMQPSVQQEQNAEISCCVIDSLLKIPYQNLPYEIQKRLVLKGRPISLKTTGLPQSVLNYNSWITGCQKNRCVTCWPCLLFTPEHGIIRSGADTVLQHSYRATHKANSLLLELLRDKLKQSAAIQLPPPLPQQPPPASVRNPVPQTPVIDLNLAISSGECIIDLLTKFGFESTYWTDQSRLDIIRRGRPCPNLTSVASNPNCNLTGLYGSINWLAGSLKLNKLFCWPCLLFGTCRFEMNCNVSVNSTAKQHRLSKFHLQAMLNFKKWEKKVEIPQKTTALDENMKTECLKRLIEVGCFVNKNTIDISLNYNSIIELMDLVINNDDYLSRFSSDLKSTYGVYVPDVSTCLQDVIRKQISKEIAEAPYVAMVLEDVADVVDKSFIATFICYVSDAGDFCERFLHFDRMEYDRSAGTVIQMVSKVIDEFDIKHKLVGVTYNGTVLDPLQAKKFQSNLEHLCPLVAFFDYGGHDLRITLLQSLSHIKELRYFFRSLNCNFKSSQNLTKLYDYYNKDILDGFLKDEDCQWFFECMAANYERLTKHFDDLVSVEKQNGKGERHFRYIYTQFLVVLLAKICSRLGHLSLSLKSGDQNEIKRVTSQFILNLLTIEAQGYNQIMDIAKGLMPEEIGDLPDDHGWFRNTFETILKHVHKVVMFRTEDNKLKSFLRRYMSSLEVPKEELGSILRRSRHQFHIERLISQFDFTNRSQFVDRSPRGLIRSIRKFKMSDDLSELHRFLRLLILTSSPGNDDGSSAIKKMRLRVLQNRYLFSDPAHAHVCMNSSLLDELQKGPDFFTDALDILVKNNLKRLSPS